MRDINVTVKVTVRFKDKETEMTKAEAMLLLAELKKALGDHHVVPNIPDQDRMPIPTPYFSPRYVAGA